jgi:prepilin-type N-terminal cleavage/methylation domain-containing protein
MRGEKFILMDGKGFSLIELLVAMAMSGLVAMAAYTVFSTSNWSSAVQEQVSEAQQNVRVGMDRLSADIRVAGFGLPDPPFSLDFNGNAFTGPITITNSSTDPDTITVLGIGFEAAALENDADNNGTVDDADCNGSGDNFICLDSVTNTNNFYNDDQSAFLAVRRHVSLDGVRYFQLDTVGHDRANKKLKLVDSTFLDRDCRDGVKVYVLQAVRYAIATDLEGCSAANPCLTSADFTMLRGGSTPGARQVMAESIEDLQFAYSLDGSPNFTNSASSNSTDIVAVRASIVGRTRAPDFKAVSVSSRPAMEDRAAAGNTDGYRRRTLTSIIKVRNPKTGS